jgi:hypothetical protein
MSLEDDVTIGDRSRRLQALDVEPIRLDMTALVKPALLTLVTADDEGMRYISGLSDLMDETERQVYKVSGLALSSEIF